MSLNLQSSNISDLLHKLYIESAGLSRAACSLNNAVRGTPDKRNPFELEPQLHSHKEAVDKLYKALENL